MTLRVSIIIYIAANSLLAQYNDTTHYPWPVPPLNSSQSLTGTFGEFRNTGSSDHFHNAVDISEPNNYPVYTCIDGVVFNKVTNGYDSYINVKSIINGNKKHITYYHVVPNPSLSVGQNVFASQTILGTIYDGAGHVHLIERELLDQSSSSIGNEINPIRPDGGLIPYLDSYSPVINKSSLKFVKDNSTIELPSKMLTGKVDIRIEVKERNGTDPIHTNNGTYILGYRVFSEDGNMTIYEPDNDGVKYRFYRLPSSNYVHSAFVKNVATLSKPIYWLTNGRGEKLINSDLTIPNNYLDTDLIDQGNYLLEVFSEDTRGNKTAERFPISIFKLPPELRTVIVSNDTITFSWDKYKTSNLLGYRIYYSDDRTLYNWKLVADESMLTALSTHRVFSNPNSFLQPSTKSEFNFYLTAIDTEGNESIPSDIYSTSFKSTELLKAIIVDGFDRFGGTGSWLEPQHYFNTFYFDALIDNLNINISSCSNEAVIEEEVELTNYDIVIWFVGDESIQDNTVINEEQYRLALYLESGGKLFISGEDIGQDLDTKHSFNEFSDTLFYHQYLKANLKHDGLDLLFEVNGKQGTLFEGLNVVFGETYPSDAPDDIEPINGAHTILNYTYERDSTYRKGGIAYTGTFGKSNISGELIYISFPFETISNGQDRRNFMNRILQSLGIVIVPAVDEGNSKNELVNKFNLKQNYPNPFNPTTTIEYSIPNTGSLLSTIVQLRIFDVLGREVTKLVGKQQKPGNYKVTFDASILTSGIYYYQLKADQFVDTKKMIILK